MRNVRFALAAVAALAAAPALPIEVADGKLSINGNGSWAMMRTSENQYLAGTRSGSYQNAMFDLLLVARPRDELVLTAQAGFDPEGVGLEWAFGEWRFSDLLRVRAGKVKQPVGNYAELQFVGTARPFFALPTSVYGPSDIAGESYSGAGITGEKLFDSGYGIGYDLYGGEMQLKVYEPFDVAFDPNLVPAPEEMTAEDLVGGRVSLMTPWDVTVRVSAFRAKMLNAAPEPRSAVTAAGVSVWHRGETVWLSAEAFRTSMDTERQWAAYLEAAAFATKHLQVAAQYQIARVDESGLPSSPLRRHDEVGVGVNWWFDPNVVVKASVHRVWGSRFTVAETPDVGVTPSGATTLVVVGTQFAF
jgi:hypothetical protein